MVYNYTSQEGLICLLLNISQDNSMEPQILNKFLNSTRMTHGNNPREWPTSLTHENDPWVWPTRVTHETHVTHAIWHTQTVNYENGQSSWKNKFNSCLWRSSEPVELPYSEKILRGFNLTQGKSEIFGADLIWRSEKNIKFSVDLIWRN